MMDREEILHLILLEADGGLSAADADRLREVLKDDPALQAERRQIQRFWDDVGRQSRSLALPDGFGEDRLAEWMQPRPEGLLVWGPLRIAAAFVLTATLVHAWAGPRPVAEVAEVPASSTRESQLTAATHPVQAGDCLVAAAGEVVVLELSGGSRLQFTDATVRVETATQVQVVRVGRRAQLDMRLGERPIAMGVAGRHVQGTRARFQVEAREDDASLEIVAIDGHVVLKDRGRRRALVPGERASLGTDAVMTPVVTSGEKRHETERATPPPMQVERVPSVPSTSPEQPDDRVTQNTQVVMSQVRGTVRSVLLGLSVSGATVRLTRTSAPAAGLDRLLEDAPQALQNRWRFEGCEDEVGRAEYFAVTDADGAYQLDFVPSGLYEVDVRMPAFSRFADVEGGLLRVHQGQLVESSFRVTDGVSLMGQVVDDYGRAVAGAVVSNGGRTVTCDASGSFTLHGVALTGRRVLVEAPGLAPVFVGADELRFPVVLKPASPLRVALGDSFGRSLPGNVRAFWEENGHWFERRLVAVVGDTLETAEVPEHVEVLLRATSPGFAVEETTIAPEATRNSVLPLTLTRGFPGDLLVQSDAGLALSGVEVLGPGQSVLTDPTGRAELRRLDLMTLEPVILKARDRAVEWTLLDPRQDSTVILGDAPLSRIVTVRDASEAKVPAAFALWVIEDSRGRWLDVVEMTCRSDGDFDLPTLGDSFLSPPAAGRGQLKVRVLVGQSAGSLWSGQDDGESPVLEAVLSSAPQGWR